LIPAGSFPRPEGLLLCTAVAAPFFMGNAITLIKTEIEPDAVQIGRLFAKAKSSMVESLKYYVECGQSLKAIKDSLPHGEWLPWLKAQKNILGFGEWSAQRMMKAAETKTWLTTDLDDSQALTLSQEIWGNSSGGFARQMTGFMETNTPALYVEAVRKVMGGIDLDPASNDEAQKTVQAKIWHTENGLKISWPGRVFLNPPYKQPLIQQFVDKLLASIEQGDTQQAISAIVVLLDG